MTADATMPPPTAPLPYLPGETKRPATITAAAGGLLGAVIGAAAGQQAALMVLKGLRADESLLWTAWVPAVALGIVGLKLAMTAVAKDFRFLMPLLITSILTVAQLKYGVLESLPQTLAAIATSILCEVILSRLVRGTWPSLVSAYIGGISVGILLRSPDVWPYVVCAAMAIVSKYAIRAYGRHIWNPSNFSVTAMLVLYPGVVTSLNHQWGNYEPVLLLIWALGAFIVGRLKRLHICLTYVVCFTILAAPRALIVGWGQIVGAPSAAEGLTTFWERYLVEFAPITGPMYQLFTFFMITDPATTVRGYRGQIAVAACIALAECVIRLLPVWGPALGIGQMDAGLIASKAPYLALFLVGPIANLIEIFVYGVKERIAGPRPAVARAAVPA